MSKDPHEAVAGYYDTVADEYHKKYNIKDLYEHPEYPSNFIRLQIILSRLSSCKVKRVYEIGAGDGTPLVAMAQMGLEVAGCDVSTQMVAKCRENLEKAGLPSDVVQVADGEDRTSFENQIRSGKFDAVVANGVLPHVRNERLFLENTKILLRPGGKAFIEFRNKLFSLFTFNRYTKQFILDDLLSGVSEKVKEVVAQDLERRVAGDQPQLRLRQSDGSIGYDAILSKFHNPFSSLTCFAKADSRTREFFGTTTTRRRRCWRRTSDVSSGRLPWNWRMSILVGEVTFSVAPVWSRPTYLPRGVLYCLAILASLCTLG